MGDAHDAADVLVFHAHLVENEEEGVVGGIGSVFLLDAAESGEVDGLIVVDEAFPDFVDFCQLKFCILIIS